jgi:hypothetical protein
VGTLAALFHPPCKQRRQPHEASTSGLMSLAFLPAAATLALRKPTAAFICAVSALAGRFDPTATTHGTRTATTTPERSRAASIRAVKAQADPREPSKTSKLPGTPLLTSSGPTIHPNPHSTACRAVVRLIMCVRPWRCPDPTSSSNRASPTLAALAAWAAWREHAFTGQEQSHH